VNKNHAAPKTRDRRFLPVSVNCLLLLTECPLKYISSQVEALHQSPAEIIAAMVRKELIATA
jgi:hypothetical protein